MKKKKKKKKKKKNKEEEQEGKKKKKKKKIRQKGKKNITWQSSVMNTKWTVIKPLCGFLLLLIEAIFVLRIWRGEISWGIKSE